MDKMRFSLKSSERTYDLELGCKVKNFLGNVILASSPIALFYCYRVVLMELGLIEGFPQIWGSRTICWSTQRICTT
jgi:hypothetical protein